MTGAASGMGLGIARRLAADGNRVALLDLDGDSVTQAAAEIGDRAIATKVDVTDRGGVDDAIARARAELGPVEIVVTSAASTSSAPSTRSRPMRGTACSRST